MTSNPPFGDADSAIPGVPHRWNALTIALTVIGFIVFWPLGVAMILYVVFGEQLKAATRNSGGGFAKARQAAEDWSRTVRDELRPRGSNPNYDYARTCGGFGGAKKTGNAAFDTWREAELRRIDEERRKLDETTAAFEAHLRAERGESDQNRQRDEFDRFMQGRQG